MLAYESQHKMKILREKKKIVYLLEKLCTKIVLSQCLQIGSSTDLASDVAI